MSIYIATDEQPVMTSRITDWAIATDEQPVMTSRITDWADTVWDITIGDQRITVRSEPVVRQHDHTIVVALSALREAADQDSLYEYLCKKAHNAALRKGVPMPPGAGLTIKHSLATETAEYRWVWWSVEL